MQIYQLSFLTLLGDWYLDPIVQGVIILWATPLSLLAIRSYRRQKEKLFLMGKLFYYGFILLLFGLWVGAPLWFGLYHLGSGYQIPNDYLRLKIPPVTETIEIQKLLVCLVEDNTQWEVTQRKGTQTYHLFIGWCKLKNGEKALVFKHHSSKEKVILWDGNRYYVIAHPGVEEFYRELINRGAKEVSASNL
jgi:hypothetical protein